MPRATQSQTPQRERAGQKQQSEKRKEREQVEHVVVPRHVREERHGSEEREATREEKGPAESTPRLMESWRTQDGIEDPNRNGHDAPRHEDAAPGIGNGLRIVNESGVTCPVEREDRVDEPIRRQAI